MVDTDMNYLVVCDDIYHEHTITTKTSDSSVKSDFTATVDCAKFRTNVAALYIRSSIPHDHTVLYRVRLNCIGYGGGKYFDEIISINAADSKQRWRKIVFFGNEVTLPYYKFDNKAFTITGNIGSLPDIAAVYAIENYECPEKISRAAERSKTRLEKFEEELMIKTCHPSRLEQIQ